MRHPRLLIFGINYAPEPTGIAVQSTGLAEGLGARGWHVTVITGIPHYPAWRPGNAPKTEDQGSVQVTRRRHFVPPRQSVLSRAAYEVSWLASCLRILIPPREVDAVLGVTPSLGGALLASLGAARWRAPYVVMFQDLLGPALRQVRVPGAKRVAGMVSAAELFCARHAAAVAVIGDGFRPYLLDGGVSSERIHRVRNPVRMAPARGARFEVRQRLGWAEDELIVLHSGNMGAKQGLENVIRAAAETGDDERIRFVLQGDGNQRRFLEAEAKRLAPRNITFAPLAPPEELADVLAAADVLLLNQRGEVRDMSLPGKLATYFAVGRPVVVAASSDSETAREVVESGAGILVEPDQPSSLLAGVRQLAARPELRAALGEKGRDYADRELQPAATADLMDALLRSLPRPGTPWAPTSHLRGGPAE